MAAEEWHLRHRVSIRQIEGFLLASELLSFSRASEKLHITQSAFSQLIRELESQLGVQLFDRTTRRVHLTAAGEAMKLKMKRGLDAIDDACDEAQAIARVDRGHIRLASLSSMAIGIVTRTLSHVRADFPGVTVSLREDANDRLVELVAAGDTDMSVCTEIASAPGLSFDPMFDDELVVVMQRGNPLARQRTLSWEQLEDEPLVLTARGTSTRASVSAALSRHGMGKPVEFEVASMPTSVSLVRAGFGSTFISRVALLDLDTRGLKAVRLREPPLRRMGIYFRADRAPAPAALKFTELLKLEVAATLSRLR